MPSAPTIRNAHSHPPLRMAHTTNGGANSAPIDEPMLNQPIATERSFAGNHSVVAFTPAGIPAASAAPSAPRDSAIVCQLVPSAVAAHATDHARANTAKPILVPTASST